MLHMIGHAIFGLVVGLIARFLLPGADHFGLIVTAIIGLVGGVVGGWIGRAVGWYQPGQPAGFLMSIVGAMALLLIFRFIA
jgi:uncharacterized membrane protein YeaQ/YmgE (transglycosylase-associated protein family)